MSELQFDAVTRTDCVHRFLFENYQIRGQVVTLEKSFQQALDNKSYPPVIAAQLGQAFAAVALLANTIKIDGSLILQLQGDGCINTLVTQATDQGDIRGLVHWDDERLAAMESHNFSDLFGKGRLVMTIDGEDNQRYQGVVEIIGSSLSEAIGCYFTQSEQLETQLWLGSVEGRCGGILLQQLPEASNKGDQWNHVVTLASTITDAELSALPAVKIVHRLFHEEQVLLYAPSEVVFNCSCSRAKIEAVLLQLGHDEIAAIAKNDGQVQVDCEFCNLSYVFDQVDVSALFLATADSSRLSH